MAQVAGKSHSGSRKSGSKRPRSSVTVSAQLGVNDMKYMTPLELRRLRVKYECARERFHSYPTDGNYSAAIKALREYTRKLGV